jgi:dCMP deaminase
MKNKVKVAHMKAAEVYSQLSYARRLQVGCVIVKNNTIIGIGYNGMPSGWDNDCEYADYFDDGDSIIRSKPEVLHAETNAIAKVAKSTNSTEDADLFVTHAPCLDCAKLIHQSGIKRVFYRDTYRSEDGLNFLKQCNIEVENVKELSSNGGGN